MQRLVCIFLLSERTLIDSNFVISCPILVILYDSESWPAALLIWYKQNFFISLEIIAKYNFKGALWTDFSIFHFDGTGVWRDQKFLKKKGDVNRS